MKQIYAKPVMQPTDTNPLPAESVLENATALGSLNDEGVLMIPLVEEQLQVGKALVETGRVQLTKTVEQRDEVVSTPLLHQTVTVERVPVGRYVDVAPASRQEGNVTIYPVLNEVIVVEKRLLLVEEIHVTSQQQQTLDQQTVTLRREVLTVARDGVTSERPV